MFFAKSLNQVIHLSMIFKHYDMALRSLLYCLASVLFNSAAIAGTPSIERVVVTGEGDAIESATVQALKGSISQFNKAKVELIDYSQRSPDFSGDSWIEAIDEWLSTQSIKDWDEQSHNDGAPQGIALIAKNGVISQRVIERACSDGRCEITLELVVNMTERQHSSTQKADGKSVAVGDFSGSLGEEFRRGLSVALTTVKSSTAPADTVQQYIVSGRVKNAVSIKHVEDNSHYIQRTGEYIEDRETSYRTSAEVDYKLTDRATEEVLWSEELAYSSIKNNLPELLQRAQVQVASVVWDYLTPLEVLVASNGALIVELDGRQIDLGERFTVVNAADAESGVEMKDDRAIVEVVQLFSGYARIHVVSGNADSVHNLDRLKRIKR